MEVKDEFCLDCPDEVRGRCCHMGGKIGIFSDMIEKEMNVRFPFSNRTKNTNLCLEHVICPNLNPETKLCTIYETRLKEAHWCISGDKLFGNGALPEGCLYLKEHPEREPYPKMNFKKIKIKLRHNEKAALVELINMFNNIPFLEYTKTVTMKNEVM